MTADVAAPVRWWRVAVLSSEQWIAVGLLPLLARRERVETARTKSRPGVLYPVDREMLSRLVRTGSHPAQQVRRARISLELDENDPDRGGPVPTREVVAQRAGVHVDTVVKTSTAYAERGGDVEDTITRKKRLTAPVPAGDR